MVRGKRGEVGEGERGGGAVVPESSYLANASVASEKAATG